MNPLDMDSAEIKILRAIAELNNRIMMQATPEHARFSVARLTTFGGNSFALWNPSISTVRTMFVPRGVVSSTGVYRQSSGKPSLAMGLRGPQTKEMNMKNREQPAPEVTAYDIRVWLDADRVRLARLEAKRNTEPSELLEAEIAMVAATIGQFEAELHYLP